MPRAFRDCSPYFHHWARAHPALPGACQPNRIACECWPLSSPARSRKPCPMREPVLQDRPALFFLFCGAVWPQPEPQERGNLTAAARYVRPFVLLACPVQLFSRGALFLVRPLAKARPAYSVRGRCRVIRAGCCPGAARSYFAGGCAAPRISFDVGQIVAGLRAVPRSTSSRLSRRCWFCLLLPGC